ncbi:MAG: dihydropteroate synthase [Candidatus Omnitrophica bacterium]|nr:dihydropteroate synthase [Candidatus Omnitrophota bacterium]
MIKRRCFNFTARGRLLSLGKSTALMGIVNVTPDSFSGDGQLRHKDFISQAVARAAGMVDQGAHIIDIGGESTRPGASVVTAQEEVRRVIPVIASLVAARREVIVSVDTSKALVAKEALIAGAHIVNVVQSHKVSEGLLKLVRSFEAGIVLMHMRGTPRTMQAMSQYQRLVPEIILELERIVKVACSAGLERRQIIIDPGIGFAKSAQDNFMLIRELGRFKSLALPILIGVSRKSFIGKLLDVDPVERLFGSVAAVVASVLEGAHIVRVHDIVQMKQAVSVADAVLSGGT